MMVLGAGAWGWGMTGNSQAEHLIFVQEEPVFVR